LPKKGKEKKIEGDPTWYDEIHQRSPNSQRLVLSYGLYMFEFTGSLHMKLSNAFHVFRITSAKAKQINTTII
jgi:hypothetical protein